MGFFGVRAQASSETMVILAIGLVALLGVSAFVYDQLSSYNAQQQLKIGSNVVKILAREANDAYFLGPGTVKNIVVVMPSLVDFSKSFINGKAIVLNVAGSDIVGSAAVDVYGSWPNSDGSYAFVITAYEGYVTISSQPLSFSPAQITEVLTQGNSRDVSLVATNTFSTSLAYTMVIDFPSDGSSGASLSSAESNPVSFSGGESKTISFTASCASNSFGTYSGSIFFMSVSGDYNLSVPVNVVCSSSQQKLVVYPLDKHFSAESGSPSTQSVLVCNNSSVAFPSSRAVITGDISNYVFTSFSGVINASSCRTLQLNVSASGEDGDIFLGRLSVIAGGFTAYADLNLIVVAAPVVVSNGAWFRSIADSSLAHSLGAYGNVRLSTDANAYIADGGMDWNTASPNYWDTYAFWTKTNNTVATGFDANYDSIMPGKFSYGSTGYGDTVGPVYV